MVDSSGMQIEVFSQPDGLHGEPEVWIKVLSNRAVDLPEVLAVLTDAQSEVLKPSLRKPTGYYPHLVTAEEKAEHSFGMEDWWTFTAPRDPDGLPAIPYFPRSVT